MAAVSGATLLGLWVAARRDWPGEPRGTVLERSSGMLAAGLIGAVLLAGFLHWSGMRQFGGFDQSMVIDYGWRLLNGQRPGIEFPNTTPPAFMLGAWAAFALGGVNWSAITGAASLFGAGTFAWSLLMLRALLGRGDLALLFAMALALMVHGPLGYWWYNPATSAAAVLYLLSVAVLLLRVSPLRWLSYALALALLALCKPNVAALLIGPVSLVLLSSQAHRLLLLPVSLAVALLLWSGLSALGIEPVALMRGYLDVSGRGLELGMYFRDGGGLEVRAALLGLFATIVLPLGLAVLLGWYRGLHGRLAAIGVAGLFAGLNSFASAGESKFVDTAIVFAAVLVLVRAAREWSADSLPSRALVALAVALGLSACVVGITRHRVLGIGFKTFFEYRLAPATMHEGFFAGLRSGPRFQQTFAQVAAVLNTTAPGSGSSSAVTSVYFGPRMQWGYAAFGRPSPRGQPVWWHPGTSFALAERERLIDALLAERPALMIFLKNDHTYFPPSLPARLARWYDVDQSFTQLTLYRRRADGPAAPPR